MARAMQPRVIGSVSAERTAMLLASRPSQRSRNSTRALAKSRAKRASHSKARKPHPRSIQDSPLPPPLRACGDATWSLLGQMRLCSLIGDVDDQASGLDPSSMHTRLPDWRATNAHPVRVAYESFTGPATRSPVQRDLAAFAFRRRHCRSALWPNNNAR